MQMTCPHCAGEIRLTVEKTTSRRQPVGGNTGATNTPGVRRAVRAFARELVQRHPGQWTNTVLRSWYEEWAHDHGGPPMGMQVFSTNLAACGLQRWRHGTGRGFVIPATLPAPLVPPPGEEFQPRYPGGQSPEEIAARQTAFLREAVQR